MGCSQQLLYRSANLQLGYPIATGVQDFPWTVGGTVVLTLESHLGKRSRMLETGLHVSMANSVNHAAMAFDKVRDSAVATAI